mgnify:FL=1|jgi:hypothetical protein|tara:strand:- start:838 stop:1161 length:324 start_codon:yes stop_codon:yes gene_type:complete
MKNIKEWILEKEKDDVVKIEDIVLHGAAGGISGLIYYKETTSFHDEHEKEIWDALDEAAQQEGVKVMDLVHRIAKDASSVEQLKNDLAWWSVEVAAGEIMLERSRAA